MPEFKTALIFRAFQLHSEGVYAKQLKVLQEDELVSKANFEV